MNRYFSFFILLSTWITNPVISQTTHNSVLFKKHETQETITSLEKYELFSAPTQGINEVMETNRLNFLHQGISYTLELTPNKLLSDKYVLTVVEEDGEKKYTDRDIHIYTGKVAGMNSSEARINIINGRISGMVMLNNEPVIIEPADRFNENFAPNDYIQYRLGDYKGTGKEAPTCEAEKLRDVESTINQGTVSGKTEGTLYVDLAFGGDYGFVTKVGGPQKAEEEMIACLNIAEGLYAQYELKFEIIAIYLSNCSSCDPWSTSGHTTTILNSFQDWGNNGGFNTDYDEAILWTSRDLCGGSCSSAGAAWVASICKPSRHGVIERYYNSYSPQARILAHEMGHNWGGMHVSGNYIMSASLASAATEWHSDNIPNIIRTRDNANCLSTTPAAPVVDLGINAITNPKGVICQTTTKPEIELQNTGGVTITTAEFTVQVDNGAEKTETINGTLEGGKTAIIPLNNITMTSGVHVLKVCVKSVNGKEDTQNNNNCQTIQVSVQENALQTPYTESFETAFNNSWSIYNPDQQLTWEATFKAASNGNRSIYVNDFNYTDSNESIEELSSPRINIAAASELSFDLAAALYEKGFSKLEVDIKWDCGAQQTNLYSKMISEISTAGPQTTEFIPNQNQWRNVSIDISSYRSKGDVQFVFRYIQDWENNIFIDNVKVGSMTTGLEVYEATHFEAYPNPTKGYIQIADKPVDYEVYNYMGMRVLSGYGSKADLSKLSAGVYQLSVLSGKSIRSQLIIKQ